MMPTKCSHSIIAALALFAAPALAQETAAPDTNNDAAASAPAQNDTAADMTKDAADKVMEAADKVKETTGQAVKGAAEDTTSANMPEGDGAKAVVAPGDAATGDVTPAETPAETPAPETPGTAPEPEPASTEQPAGQPAGQPYLHSEYSDWSINCVKLEQGADPCVLSQLLKDSTGNPVAEINFVPLEGPDVAAGGTLITPLETDLIRGIGIRIDQGVARGYQFSVCTAQDGCIARIGFTPQEIRQFKRGANATVSLLPYGADPENPVNLNMSLSGFTAGFDELAKLTEAAE